ncbi:MULTISPECIES: DUF421 domain-containing protein [unclassified Gilliamella]|uniref:DUF421 domain-containing protein n=1 Tax=unclassified Gilliamella TaxID=2685620 RepID=UPI001C69E9C2|nr:MULTISPECIES: YetF domain-containing protein [unclassified Gilliamella]MCX8602207.1 DUF421 domain-containing protein [Gilliamella sp. B3722]MCX8607191.1 DUF421 domain-containing protein [Gilliamella sp. B3771]MCX8611477.1 DUF421 domain-containing protein [Gilliamella sp. B3891]MCX8613947.1 DUF421 domain-containing protein [Gilliamella sp. B3773]MCX8614923.1 DUF421 domain-containing protein [Gilliamella sp. B3770]
MYLLSMAPKFLLALIILLIYVKLSGKSQIAPMSQLDQVGSMVIGALVGGALLSPTVSAWESAGLVAIWAGLLILIRFIKSKNSRLRDAIDGEPIQLVKNGNLLSDNFIKANLPVRDFETLVNIQGISSFDQLKQVWYELNGSLTIIKKGEKDIAVLIIENGGISHDNLEQLKKSEDWVKSEIKKQGYDKIEDIFCAEWFDNKFLIYPYDSVRNGEANK